MDGQILDRAAGTGADDVGAPAVAGEAVGKACGEGEGRIAPEEIGVVVVHRLLVDEGPHGVLFRIIGLAEEETGDGQAHVAGILRLAEGVPLRVGGAREDILKILEEAF